MRLAGQVGWLLNNGGESTWDERRCEALPGATRERPPEIIFLLRQWRQKVVRERLQDASMDILSSFLTVWRGRDRGWQGGEGDEGWETSSFLSTCLSVFVCLSVSVSVYVC